MLACVSVCRVGTSAKTLVQNYCDCPGVSGVSHCYRHSFIYASGSRIFKKLENDAYFQTLGMPGDIPFSLYQVKLKVTLHKAP